jgi:hypothetical protein
MTSQNIDVFSWNILYSISCRFVAMILFPFPNKFQIPSSSASSED